MVLTEKQVEIINKFLIKVKVSLNSNLEKDIIKQLVVNLRDDILRSLDKHGRAYITDEELVKFLFEQYGTPDIQAKKLLAPQDLKSKILLDHEKKVWLGVCSGIAKRFGVNCTIVRLLFSILGLLGGVGFILYLFMYFFLYFTTGPYRGKNIHWWSLLFQVVITLSSIILVFSLAYYVFQGLLFLQTNFVGHDAVDPSLILKFQRDLIFVVLLFSYVGVLFSLYGSLPLKNEWDKTFRNLRDASIALLVLIVSAQVAYILTYFVAGAVGTLRNLTL